MATLKLCSVDGCGKGVRSKGLCNAHYLRLWRHGDPKGGALAKGVAKDFFGEALQYQGTACLFWPFAKKECGTAVLNKRGTVLRVPREVCRAVHGEPPAQFYHAAHSCGNGHLGCVNPKHLRWATPTENNLDKVDHGTHNRGERNVHSRLTENQVMEIRSFDPKLNTYAQFARRFGVTRETIRDIVQRRTWAWL